ncbi:hypothetical protein BM1_03402 [Bipolaris maydis]|nr:hypothetical protein BM1_03402 [Bipolaris maydis]
MDASASQQQAASPNGTAKFSSHSHEHGHDWSGDERSTDDDANDRGQASASNKRKRPLSVSCETCKQRKVKCDRASPACSWCLKNHSACVYLPRKKPGLRAGYGRELESRLAEVSPWGDSSFKNYSDPHKLEALLLQQQSQINNLTNNQVPTSGPSPQHATAFRSPPIVQTPHIPRPETALFIQKPTFPSQNAIHTTYGNGVTDNRPASSVASHSYTPEDITAIGGALTREPYTPYNEQFQPAMARNLGHADADFPPYDLLYGLVDLFFKHINTWCPILHRQSTLNSLFGDMPLDDADKIILHSVVATTVKFSTDQRLTPEKRTRYHKNSKEKVLLYGIENSSVKSLQALVILALDVVGCSNGRRRLFWMIYVLDRYATVATAFEFALDDKEIDRRLPCRDDLYARNAPVETRWFRTSARSDYSMNRPENLGSFSYLIEILGILTRIHKFLKKPVDITSLSDVESWQSEYRELDNAIEQWKYNLPQEYGNSARLFAKPSMGQNLDSGLVMLHAAFHTTVIRLHSSAAYPTHRSPIFTPSFSASQRCLSAVENITALCATVRDNALLSKLGPPFAFSLWVAARVLLVHGSTIDHRVDQSINLLVSTLRDMGQYWEVGTRYASLLSRVLSEYQESQQAPAGANGERVTPSTVKILADMRRCAFDLDFLISRQPKLSSNQSTKMASVTSARTPAPNELEYLDVFDFFNMPRLPVSMDGVMSYPAPDGNVQMPDSTFGNESNITNYMVDASSDWFMKQTA